MTSGRIKRSSKIILLLAILSAALGVTYNACSVRRMAGTGLDTLPSTTGGSSSAPTTPDAAVTRYLISTGLMKLTAAGLAVTPSPSAMSGRIMMVRDLEYKTTSVYVHAVGLGNSLSYPAHIHALGCAIAGGGGHYKIDPSVAAAVESNEVWPLVQTVADGSGSSLKIVPHVVRPEGQSFVVHDPVNASRLICGDFIPQNSVTSLSGRFGLLANGTAAGLNVMGEAVIIRSAGSNQTVVKARLKGLPPNANPASLVTFPAHVHNQNCATGDGGSHYKMNAAVTETTPSVANELWLPLTPDASGFAEQRIEVDHVARADALSIVIHEPTTGNRLACVDLATAGGFMSTMGGLQKNLNILGSAMIERLSNGSTKVSMSISGLTPNNSYTAHVHDRPCHIAAGGGHYKKDYSIAAAQESNEIWLRLSTDAAGSGSTSNLVEQHMARPEAQSIVIHDPDNSRIACVDIY